MTLSIKDLARTIAKARHGTFGESRRLQRSFSDRAAGRFSIVYAALRACANKAKGGFLKEEDVLREIDALIAQPDGAQ